MNYLSLFSGAMGGDLGYQHILKWRCTGYVEIEDYCQRVIKQRQLDGLADKAPIFTDIKAFIDSGCCELYKGITDVITAGFPCQPFSVAGKQDGERDSKNRWPETIECIRRIRPRYAFLENVPGLIANGYIRRIFGDLADSGYDCKWKVVPATVVGSPHVRKRIWILAYPKRKGLEGYKSQGNGICIKSRTSSAKFGNRSIPCGTIYEGLGEYLRVGNELGRGVEQIRAIGNGQVPVVAATAWRLLMGEINK